MFSNLDISYSGMVVDAFRMRLIAENIANKDTTSLIPGGEPYRRKLPVVINKYDKDFRTTVLKILSVNNDKTDFERSYDPGHPAADANGYVLRPNVNMNIEVADAKEAQASYMANLSMMQISRNMIKKSIRILSSNG